MRPQRLGGVGVAAGQRGVERFQGALARGQGGREGDGEGQELLAGHRVVDAQFGAVSIGIGDGADGLREVDLRVIVEGSKYIKSNVSKGPAHLPNTAIARLRHLFGGEDGTLLNGAARPAATAGSILVAAAAASVGVATANGDRGGGGGGGGGGSCCGSRCGRGRRCSRHSGHCGGGRGGAARRRIVAEGGGRVQQDILVEHHGRTPAGGGRRAEEARGAGMALFRRQGNGN